MLSDIYKWKMVYLFYVNYRRYVGNLKWVFYLRNNKKNECVVFIVFNFMLF